MIGEQQTKQSSVYFCSLIEASITIVIISPQFGQLIWYSTRRLIDAFEKPIFLMLSQSQIFLDEHNYRTYHRSMLNLENQ